MLSKCKSLLRGTARWRAYSTPFAVLLAVGTLAAQERYGEIRGTATDPSGAVLPGVKVTLTNKAQGRDYATTTGLDGSYQSTKLDPGHYSAKFEIKGFSTHQVADINLLLGQTLTVNAALNISSTEQQILVTEAAPLIDTTNTTIANNITSEEIDRLPKPRSFQALALNSPSVNSGDVEGGFQVNGASGAENNFTIDGISTNSIVDGRSRQNALFEILQEVQVKTGGISAEYGGALGGVISAISKSGGNAFHGDVHFYFAGNGISASPVKRLILNPADDKTVGYFQDPKQASNSYEMGYTLGGYLIKNRVYFFSAASPNWTRRTNNYLFGNGTQPDAIDVKRLDNMFYEKLSFDVTKNLRANVFWMASPTYSTGRLPAYDGAGGLWSTSSMANAQTFKTQGFSQPQSNYGADFSYVVTPTTFIAVRAGRFWDNYKDTGIPNITPVQYQTPATSLPFDIPANLRQPTGFFNTPRVTGTTFDIGTRNYIQGDFNKMLHAFGTHDLKIGGGIQKNVNKVDTGYPKGFIYIWWDRSFTSNATGQTQRGTYGYYEYDNQGTKGSTGADLANLYIQDNWRIHPRLTLNLGLRTEKEVIPSFQRAIKDPAFEFGFSQKMAPRVGASWDVRGNGKWKIYGSFGRYYDWVKYELARGTFGGDVWTIQYRSLDTPDVFSLNSNNLPGKNLWSDVAGSFRNRRVPGFNYIDPQIQPMSSDIWNAGTEYEIMPQTVLRVNFVNNRLRRTIEDLGALVNGDEVYYYANPGEGNATITPTSGKTQPFATPKPVRDYKAVEFSLTRRFARGWFGSASYVWSRLYGNYAGLANSDEIQTPTTGVSSATTQQQGGSIARPGSSATRAWDIDEVLWDSHGNLDVKGRLATDRPHVFKLYGSKVFEWRKFGASDIGGFFYAGSGTPVSTYVSTINQTQVFVNGRGDLGRTPVLTRTDLLVGHNFKISEKKLIRLEFNAQNLFNQKTARHIFNNLNRDRRQSAAIDLSNVDLAKGYDYKSLISSTPDKQNSYDPRFGMEDLFQTGFAGRFMLKFVF